MLSFRVTINEKGCVFYLPSIKVVLVAKKLCYIFKAHNWGRGVTFFIEQLQ